MQNAEELAEIQARAAGDQVAAMMRSNMSYLSLLARTDPSIWNETDRRLIQATLYGVVGFLYEGRI
jgi:predicted metal-dependent hydrolase